MKKRIAIIAVLLLLGLTAGLCTLWWNGRLLPGWVTWHELETALTPYHSSGTLILKGRRLRIVNEEAVLFETPRDWYVSDVRISDFDLDGRAEVLFLLWRHGDYGASHPFWETPDRLSFYQHLYIYKLESEGMKRQWMSSALNPKIKEWDIDEDQNLIILSDQNERSVWQWYGYSVRRTE